MVSWAFSYANHPQPPISVLVSTPVKSFELQLAWRTLSSQHLRKCVILDERSMLRKLRKSMLHLGEGEVHVAVAVRAGTIPGELGKLTALVTLYLEGNELTGEENARWLLVLVGFLACHTLLDQSYRNLLRMPSFLGDVHVSWPRTTTSSHGDFVRRKTARSVTLYVMSFLLSR